MKVLKFGGSSIGNANRIRKVVNIILDNDSKIVVFSAFQSITNLLSDFIKQSNVKNWIVSEQIIDIIRETHEEIINDLIISENFRKIALNKLNISVKKISKYQNKKIKDHDEGYILAQGELLSTMIIFLYLLETGVDVALLSALTFIKLNTNREPNYEYTELKLNQELNKHKGCKLFVTQGFICQNDKNHTDNLGRGGSDFTATIIGTSLKSELIEIWTDINGIHNNDPRYVKETKTINRISYEAANELAYFGAKILHPDSIVPAMIHNIPIVVKNTMNPNESGTTICKVKSSKIKAIAAKDNIVTIKIKSARMMNAYGFLKKVFEVFETYQTSVDMLTTSEISVAMTIDNKKYLNEIIHDLSKLGETHIETNQSIICIIGDYTINRNLSIQNIIESLNNIPINMISFGSSNINISLVIDSENKVKALNQLNSFTHNIEPCLTIV